MSTVAEDVEIKDASSTKADRNIKQELTDLTVVDDSEIEKINDDKCKESKQDCLPKSEKAKAESPEKKSQAVEQDSLILTADDEMFSVVSNDKDSPRKTQNITNDSKPKLVSNNANNKSDKVKDDEKKPLNKPRANSSDSSTKNLCRSLWVANVSRSSKASDLKQHFSKYGKVSTAKIVTDGKNFYGYLSFETREDADRCMRKLDGVTFEDRKLKLSFTRPNQETARETTAEKRKRSSIERKPKKKTEDNDPLTTKFRSKKSKSPSYREKQLERDYLREKREAERLKRRVQEQEELNRLERRRQRQREEEHREMEWKLQMQKKKLQIEREMFEKERKDLIRLDEVRRKIEEERLEILKERAKIKDALRNARKTDSKKRNELIDKDDDKRRKSNVKSKICDASYNKNKGDDNYGGRYRKNSKDRVDFPRAPPPPPKLSEGPKTKIGRNYDASIHRRDDDSNKKNERDYRNKIETIHRERKAEFLTRRDRFVSRNQQRDGGFNQPEAWKTSFVNKPWEVDSNNGRYEQNSSYQTTGGGYNGQRMDGGYCYHTNTPSTDEDYPRYQQYNMHLERKY